MRFCTLFCTASLAILGTIGYAQDPGENSATDTNGETNEIPVPENLFEKLEPLKNPPLALGHTGDRVRELQATLNLKLGGKVVALGYPIYVGPALGPSPEIRNKLRIALSRRRNIAFQIRGDWIPCDKDGNPIVFDPNSDRLKPVSFLHLPSEPLKVDGVYGQHTQAGVALFELENSLPVTGEVDAVTLDKLEPMVPTNPLLASIMRSVGDIFNDKKDNYPYWVKTTTSLVMTILILLASTVVFQIARMLSNSTHLLSRWLFTPASSPWFSAFRESKVFANSAQFAPALFIYWAAIATFPSPDERNDVFPYLNTFQEWQVIVSRLGLAYLSLVFMLVAFAFANAVDSVCNPDHSTENPIGSIVRASKRFIGLIGTLLVIASFAGQNPFFIVGSLGAFMALFMLVFRDYLIGLMSSIQIIANNVVRIGDWITMPKYNADGDVQEISLTLIKVQNFDKTISTIPTSAVLTESFQNWNGMRESGGRRIKRAILIDMRSIHVCSPDLIAKCERIELLREYIQRKKKELEEFNREHDIEASPVNSRRLTNIGTFRAYLDSYLRNHPGLSDEMTFLVRHLQPTNNGLPVEIYAFCKETSWSAYEAVQADIFDHVLAILPEFGLRAFQEITEIASLASASAAWSAEPRAALAEIESMVEAENAQLMENPRTRVSSRVKQIGQRICELGLENTVQVSESGRSIVLRHLDRD